ncbi:MAG: hypothetical protein A2V81_04885 [Candidatus Abawacabacteria bacterium RBG_16_42_10]|uniref:Damage-inducible protein J n=1 Tax=Candidatus Abawacabacteria bacterium RBG_16_42_10 TaxID=1817814 RepID=A0A1F4XIX5_9BACT|nr:MAG: hypothetical protein A2V81_04885 [Candidatus Abawacabacteria bacterium RBG_16_42_10]
MTNVVQVRLDNKLKKEAETVLHQLGLDLPTAIRIFLTKVTQTHSIPFALTLSNTNTEDADIISSYNNDERFGPFNSVEAMMTHMKKNK